MAAADYRMMTDATGQRIAEALEAFQAVPYVATIPTGQWSGSGNDRYITVQASNVTANSMLVPHYDSASEALLNGPIWCVPAAGSFTIHTSAIPAGTVTVMVQLLGTLGEAQYQVLADVYSTSQVDSIVQQSTATKVSTSDIVNNLTTNDSNKPGSAAMLKALAEMFAIADISYVSSSSDKTTHTINVPNNSLHFLIIQSTTYAIHAYGIVASTSSGDIYTGTMQTSSGIALTDGTGSISVNVGASARPLTVLDIRMRGTGFCTLS